MPTRIAPAKRMVNAAAFLRTPADDAAAAVLRAPADLPAPNKMILVGVLAGVVVLFGVGVVVLRHA